MMPIRWQQTIQQKIEIALWIAGRGPVTPAVTDAWMRNGVTFGIALITRKMSHTYLRN